MTYDVIVLLNRQMKTHRKLTGCYIMLKLQATALRFSLLSLWWFSQQTPQTTSRLNFVHSPCLDRHRSQTNTVLVSVIFPSSVMWRTNLKFLGQVFCLFSCRLPWMKTNQNKTCQNPLGLSWKIALTIKLPVTKVLFTVVWVVVWVCRIKRSTLHQRLSLCGTEGRPLFSFQKWLHALGSREPSS